MKEDDKKDFAPDFPYPYEHFGKEMEADVRELHYALKEKETIENDLLNAKSNLKGVSPFHFNHKGQFENVLFYQSESKRIDEKITGLTKKTYGQLKTVLIEHETDSQLSKQVILALDEKVYPEKYEDNIQDKEIGEGQNSIDEKAIEFLSLIEQQKNKDKTLDLDDKLKNPSDDVHLNFEEIDNKIERTFMDFSKNKTDIDLDQE